MQKMIDVGYHQTSPRRAVIEFRPSESQPLPSKQSWARRAIKSPTLYAIVGLLILSVWLLDWIASMGGPAAIREAYGVVAPLVTIPIHIVLAITPFPSDFVSIANGAVYGFYLGAAISWFAWWIAAILEFGLGYRARKDFDLEDAMKGAPSWVRRIPVEHPAFLIGLRQIPWLGGHLTAFVPGAAGVGLCRFVWCSAIAVIPGSIVMAAFGAGLVGVSQ